MADANRKHQIAAAKKKLKQFQKNGNPVAAFQETDILSTSSALVQNKPTTEVFHTNNVSQPATRSINHGSLAAVNHGPVVNHGPEVNHAPPAVENHSPPGVVKYTSPAVENHFPSSVVNQSSTAGCTVNTLTVSSTTQPLTSSTESLHQLSRKVTDIIAESGSYRNGDDGRMNHSGIEELERRNRELAAMLDQQTQTNSQLAAQLENMKQQNSHLQQNIESDQRVHDEKLKREMSALKEQLQVHIQTIGMLVAEKTELQSSLSQNQRNVEAHQAEMEEMAGRLKTSRQRVSDLERNLSTTNTSSQRNEMVNKELSKELDKLKMEVFKVNKSNEDTQQHNLELQEKLQKKISELTGLEDELIDLRGKLEMSELNVQQLKGGTGEQVDSQAMHKIETLLSEKSELSTKLHHQEESVERMKQESSAMKSQYTQLMEQFQQQLKQTQAQICALVTERDEALTRCGELENTIEDLTEEANAMSNKQTGVSSEEKSQLLNDIADLKGQLAAVSKNLEVQVADNCQLGRLIIENEQRIVELEQMVERQNDKVVDTDQLLETSHNDKAALSRSTAQNKELKSQLAELQDRFVKMTTDNMEITTQLQNEQHHARELALRVGQQEDEIKEMLHQLNSKDQELRRRDSDRTTGASPQGGQLSSEEVEKRVSEFQQQSPLLDSLQAELMSAQDTINALTNQNTELRAKQFQPSGAINNNLNDIVNTQVETLSRTVVDLEHERNSLMDELQDTQKLKKALEDQLRNMEHDLATQVPATLNGDIITKVHFEALQHAMKQLEEKYTRVMRDRADLHDKTDRLEHIIMQLQGETDTIGEYVSLYQQQRTILRERTAEKDGYIYRLSHERIDMQNKLGQLQALVMQLLGERNMLHSYHSNNALPQQKPVAALSSMTSKRSSSSPSRAKRMKRTDNSSEGPTTENSDADWPDYSNSDSESVDDVVPQLESYPTSQSISLDDSGQNRSTERDKTAQKIMSLLNEIGTSNVIERCTYDDQHFIHCNRCMGILIVL